MRSLNEYVLTAPMADLGTAASIYMPVPDGGSITEVYVCEGAAITGATNAVTVKPNGGTSVLSLACTVSGSGAGTVISGKASSNYVKKGDYIQIATDGAGSGTCPAIIAVVIKR